MGCYYKLVAQTWNIFLTVLDAGVQDQGTIRSGIWWDFFFPSLQVVCLLVVSSCVGERESEREIISLMSLHTSALMPFVRALPLWSNYLPKALPSKPWQWGLRLQHMNFGGKQAFSTQLIQYFCYGKQHLLCLLKNANCLLRDISHISHRRMIFPSMLVTINSENITDPVLINWWKRTVKFLNLLKWGNNWRGIWSL